MDPDPRRLLGDDDAEDPVEPIAEDPPDGDADATVLLLMGPDRDRELLAEALSGRYRVETGTTAAALDDRFDCCLLDARALDDAAEVIASRRGREEGAFLPFVLLSGSESPDRPTERMWTVVDDIIELPVKRRALLARVANLIERRETSLRLERTVAELRLKERAMEESPVGITLAEADGGDNELVYLNQGFEDLTGYGAEMLGEDCRFLQGEDTADQTRAEVREAIDDERPIAVDILNYRANGQKFWNRLSIAPIRDDDGTVTHYVGFQTDITERKIRERRLEVMGRVLKHNLRNKMNLIEGYAALLEGMVDEEEQRRSVSVISDTAADLMGIADAVGKVDKTLSEPESTAPVDLRDQLVELRSRIQSRYPDADVTLSVPDDDPIPATVVGLMIAVEEAVENAVKHNDAAHPSVRVRVERRPPDWLVIEIEDDGRGIPDHETRVLESGETSLTHADRLGIWLMYWVVAKAGGEFDIETGPDGTTVRLEVPTHP